MTPEDFDALFDSFHHSVTRLETLPAYDVGGAEGIRLKAFREGDARPLRSVRTDPWLARIAVTTVRTGKKWARLRVVDEPLTEYQRYQMASYRESQAVGEQVRIVTRTHAGDHAISGDFWMFDAGHPDARAVLMSYDVEGHWLSANLTTDPRELGELQQRLSAVEASAVPLNEFLAVVLGG